MTLFFEKSKNFQKSRFNLEDSFMLILRKPTRAEYSNIIEILNVWDEMYRSIFTNQEFDERSYWKETLEGLIEWEEKRKYVCAFECTKMVGYTSYRLKNDQTVRLSDIYTHSKYQNKWVGSLLLKHVECFAKENNALVVVLETEKKASWTKAFYEKNGYIILSDYDLQIYPFDKVLEKKQVELRFIFWKEIET